MVQRHVLILRIVVRLRRIMCLLTHKLVVKGVLCVLHMKIAQLELLTPKIYILLLCRLGSGSGSSLLRSLILHYYTMLFLCASLHSF
jgi:hypothetical protein